MYDGERETGDCSVLERGSARPLSRKPSRAALLATTARSLAAAQDPSDALVAVLGAVRISLGAAGAALLQVDGGHLVPVAADGLQVPAQAIDASTKHTGSASSRFPLMLDGRLEGILVVSDDDDDPPWPRARLNAPLLPFLDLAAVALRNLRLARETDLTLQALREANLQLVLSGLRSQEQYDAAEGEVAHLNALFESLHEAVTVVDSAGSVLLMNPAARALFGVADANLEGVSRAIALLDQRQLNDTPLPPGQRPVARALRGEPFVDLELILVRPDGGRRRLVSNGSAIYGSDGQILLAVVVHRDVTALRQLERTKEEYLALISHDLRSPLTAVHGLAQVLQRKLENDTKLEGNHLKQVTGIVTNAKRMNTMIEELLESSRLEMGPMLLRKEAVDLVGLVEAVVERLGDDRVRVHATPDGSPLVIPIDTERLERVLANLITNALKYSPSDATVEVRIGRQGDEAVVSVIDAGAGIPAADLSRVFERFARIGASHHGATIEGYGLGLYIVRLIIDAHGGRIWAESEVGHGSCFSFALPTGAAA